MQNKVCLTIPVRLESERFPNKPLEKFNGISLLQHSIDIAKQLDFIDKIVIAHSEVSNEIQKICLKNNVSFFLSSENISCGTEKLLDTKRLYPQYDYYMTLPVDEPSIDPNELNRIWKEYKFGNWISTLYSDFYCIEDLIDFRSCKIVTGNSNNVVYMSRSVIPSSKSGDIKNLDIYKKHLGVFIFPNEMITKELWTKNYLSEIESLEQNMFLDKKFYCYKVKHIGFGIDSQDQIKKLEDRIWN